MNQEQLSEVAFKVIAYAGEAKTLYLQAIDYASQNQFDLAKKAMVDGQNALAKTHKYHFEAISQEAKGIDLHLTILFVHAEDIFMSAETTGNLAQKIITLYQNLDTKLIKNREN